MPIGLMVGHRVGSNMRGLGDRRSTAYIAPSVLGRYGVHSGDCMKSRSQELVDKSVAARMLQSPKPFNAFLFLASALALLACQGANAELLTGKVIGISDGDTVTILDGANQQHRIRISGIDAPE